MFYLLHPEQWCLSPLSEFYNIDSDTTCLGNCLLWLYKTILCGPCITLYVVYLGIETQFLRSESAWWSFKPSDHFVDPKKYVFTQKIKYLFTIKSTEPKAWSYIWWGFKCQLNYFPFRILLKVCVLLEC